MKRIVKEVTKWHAYLGREARGMALATDHDGAALRLGDELFDRLYAGGDGQALAAQDRDQDGRTAAWADRMHAAVGQLADFDRLAQQVRGSAAMSGVAVDRLIAQLGSMADGPEAAPAPAGRQGVPALDEAARARRAVRGAVAAAQRAVDDATELLEGLACVQLGRGTGHEQVAGQPSDARLEGQLIRALLEQTRKGNRLQRIARMAGRFRRIADNKRRERVRHGADEIVDIETGADLGRLLPSELSRLTHPLRKLALMRDLHERACLQYRMAGQEPKGRGPLVVLLDKSGSMADPVAYGQPTRDEWATAVALTLLDIAQREKRTFVLLTFDGGVRARHVVRAGQKLPLDALMEQADGNDTVIDHAYGAALDVIASEPAAARADIVLITDGESLPIPAHAAMRARALAAGITGFGIGIGVRPEALAPWCEHVEAMGGSDMPDRAAEGLFGQAA